MNAIVHHGYAATRPLPERDRDSSSGRLGANRPPRGANLPLRTQEPLVHQWLVDIGALARCRALFAGHASLASGSEGRAPQQTLMDVPSAFDQFCHSHFASVRRLHPELAWEDACPAYAIAMTAHAALCVSLDEARENLLERHWDSVRGQSRLGWAQARPLIAAGCSALDRLDPLAMHR